MADAQTFESAKKKAAAFCAYQERSVAETRRKLAEMDLPELETEAVVAWLKDSRFLNDARFAEQYAYGKFAHKQWGRLKIRQGLRGHEIPAAEIEKALAASVKPEAYAETLRALIRKSLKTHAKKSGLYRRAAIVRFLQGKGYEWEEIAAALEQEGL